MPDPNQRPTTWRTTLAPYLTLCVRSLAYRYMVRMLVIGGCGCIRSHPLEPSPDLGQWYSFSDARTAP